MISPARCFAFNIKPLTNAQEEEIDEIVPTLDKAAPFKVDVAEAVAVNSLQCNETSQTWRKTNLMPDVDPPNSILIDAVLEIPVKHGVVFLVDSEIEPEDVERLVQKTEKLAAGVIAKQFDAQTAAKFFTRSENPWILKKATFEGWAPLPHRDAHPADLDGGHRRA